MSKTLQSDFAHSVSVESEFVSEIEFTGDESSDFVSEVKMESEYEDEITLVSGLHEEDYPNG